MDVLYIILFFILGIVMGSFYNVVGFRLSKGESLIKPRSHCMKCGHVLSWYELIPIFSYLFLKGKCKSCHDKISIFYPVMELFSGVLFAISFYSFGFSYDLLVALSLSSMFIIIAVTDLNYYIIPDEVNIFFAILIFIINIFRFGFLGACTYLLYGFIMFLFIYLLMLFGNFLFKEESLGGGDIKLMFVLGMTIPIILSIFSVALSAFIALPISLFIYIKNKDKAIPFGPFLVVGFLLMSLFKIDYETLYRFLENFFY